MAVKVYGESETPSTSGTREHSSRYHRCSDDAVVGHRPEFLLPSGRYSILLADWHCPCENCDDAFWKIQHC